jgi:Leucine-rich repeat (LRR) protein
VVLSAGILELSHLQDLTLIAGELNDHQVTSYCSLPEGISRLSALTQLFLDRYHDHVDTRALLHLTSLVHLHLGENPIRNHGADWVHNLPTSLTDLKVTGNVTTSTGRPIYPKAGHVRGVPCITGLGQLETVSFQYLVGFRECEWNQRSCLAQLSGLRALEISGCGLTKVPEAVIGLSSLHSLCFGNNKLKKLPVGEYLKHLEDLILPDNRFSSVPLDALAAATALTHLKMVGNPLVWTAAQAEAVEHLERFG